MQRNLAGASRSVFPIDFKDADRPKMDTCTHRDRRNSWGVREAVTAPDDRKFPVGKTVFFHKRGQEGPSHNELHDRLCAEPPHLV